MKRSLLFALVLALIPLACKLGQTPSSYGTAEVAARTKPTSPTATSLATTAPFDYYLLNLSWSPEFCHSHANAPECAQHPAFVLHGLWPQNNSGPYPENCTHALGPRDPAQFKDIYPDQGLLRHEWSTHGTCSGLTPDDFFTAARAAFHSINIPPKLTRVDHQISLPPDQIITLFTTANPQISASSIAISCGNNYLTAVEVCLDKSLHPTDCGPIRSCRANTVRIPPPQ